MYARFKKFMSLDVTRDRGIHRPLSYFASSCVVLTSKLIEFSPLPINNNAFMIVCNLWMYSALESMISCNLEAVCCSEAVDLRENYTEQTPLSLIRAFWPPTFRRLRWKWSDNSPNPIYILYVSSN